ncbi:MAG: hypothetical protein KDA58_01500 [Planctomycetaceae bacterium]|nr:hypothetical protein [Planctomycetaceae bacterium]
MAREGIRWAANVAIALLFVAGCGHVADMLMLRISHDYVYAPHAARQWGGVLGLLAGTFLGIVDHHFGMKTISWQRWCRSWLGLLAMPVLVAISGITLGGLTKIGWLPPLRFAIPTARHMFCEGIMRSLPWGLLAAVVMIVLLRWRMRPAVASGPDSSTMMPHSPGTDSRIADPDNSMQQESPTE